MEPCADSMISTSPSRTLMAFAVLGCSAAQLSQTTVVKVSGDSCSQGRLAGRPSRLLALTAGIRLNGYFASVLLGAGCWIIAAVISNAGRGSSDAGRCSTPALRVSSQNASPSACEMDAGFALVRGVFTY